MFFKKTSNYNIAAICYLEYTLFEKNFERCEEIYFREKIVRQNHFLYLQCRSNDFKRSSMHEGEK